MTFRPRHTVIVGAGGPAGYYLARELVGRGWRVRVASRRREALERAFAGVEVEVAESDALDPASLAAAVAGCDLVVDCVGLPAERMADHVRVAENLVAAREAGARLLHVSSYWSFFPHRGEVVDEAHPREGGHAWFRFRREAEDVLLAAGAAVVHLPDFFGPRVHVSSVQMALEDAAAGKAVSCMGDPDTEREAAYLPDAIRLVADLAARGEAYGTDWAIPGNGTLSPRELARLAGEHLGRPVKVRCVPPWLLRLLALAVPSLRPAVPLAPHYSRPVRYDTTKLRTLLGDPRLTPLDDAVRRTLDALTAVAYCEEDLR